METIHSTDRLMPPVSGSPADRGFGSRPNPNCWGRDSFPPPSRFQGVKYKTIKTRRITTWKTPKTLVKPTTHRRSGITQVKPFWRWSRPAPANRRPRRHRSIDRHPQHPKRLKSAMIWVSFYPFTVPSISDKVLLLCLLPSSLPG